MLMLSILGPSMARYNDHERDDDDDDLYADKGSLILKLKQFDDDDESVAVPFLPPSSLCTSEPLPNYYS